MKKITSLLVAFFAIIALVGCGDDKKPIDSPFRLSEQKVQVTDLGGTAIVKLNAPGAWKTTVAADAKAWLSLTPSTGGGGVNMEISVKATEFIDGQSRSGKITFTMADGSFSTELTVERIDAKPSRQTDSLALVAFYNAAGGSKWTTKWNFKKSIRDWGGVATTLVGGEWRVNQLILPKENLSGTISEALATMSELEIINIAIERWDEKTRPKYLLSGKIPDAVWAMPSLKTLDVSNQNLEGPINPVIFRPTMEHVVLSGNNMGGTIPEEVGQATNLKYLRIERCDLTGEIPKSVSNLTNLEYVDLSGNSLTGIIPSFNASKKINTFIASYQCEYETVSEVQEDGVLDYNTGEKRVLISHKYISGGFTGSELVFEDMPELALLDLSMANITKTPVLKNCPQLYLIGYRNNPNLKTIDPSTFKLPGLKSLRSENCGITSLPDDIDLPVIYEFLLQQNNLTTLPASFGNMPQLQFLYLHDNDLTSLPDVFDKFPLLATAYFGHCKLTSVPKTLWGCKSLLNLELHNNEITGELPTSLAAFSSLGVFTISNNKMTGSIDALTTIRSAQQVCAHNNKFSGNIPNGSTTLPGSDIKPDIGRWVYVKNLTLDNNDLEGLIPGSFQKCTNLSYFTINNNKLSGVIPEGVVNMSRWCSFKPMANIIPQKTGYTFDYTNACK